MARWRQRTDWAEWQTDILLSGPFIAERVYRSPRMLDKTEKEVVDLAVIHGDSSILISQKAQQDPERRSKEKNELWVRKRAKQGFTQLSGAIRNRSRPIWCEHWRRGRIDFPTGLPPVCHGLVLVETFAPVDLNPDSAELPVACYGVPVTYMAVNDFLNLAVELRTVPELLDYLSSRRTLPLTALRLIGDEMPLFEFYLLERTTLNGCLGHDDAKLVVAARQSDLRELLRMRAEEMFYIKAIERVADALSTRHPDFDRGLPPEFLAAFDDNKERKKYLILQDVIANLTRAKRVHVGRALVQVSAKVDAGAEGMTYQAVYFTPEDWVFVLCASRGLERSELLRRVQRLMVGAMACYGKSRCMVIVDRDRASYEVALSRPNLRVEISDHLIGNQLFGHLRQSDMIMPVP